MIVFVGASVAAVLCVGGAIVYFICKESGVSFKWIFDHIVSYMRAAGIPRQVCIVLGRALL